MRAKLFFVMLAWAASFGSVLGKGGHACLVTTQAGSLGTLLETFAAHGGQADSLTVNGPLGGADLSVIREACQKGTFYVDLSGATLVDDGEPYRVVSPEAVGMYTYYYYYSPQVRQQSHALQQWTRIYADDLTHLFDGLEHLQEVRLPAGAGLKALGDDLFSGCTALRSVTWPTAEVRRIGARAFRSCTALTDTLRLEGIEALGDEAFARCTGLECVVTDAALQCIGDGVFSGCSSLDSLNLPAGLIQVGTEAFAGVPWYEHQPFTDGVRYVGSVACQLQTDDLGQGTIGGTVTLREGTLGLAGGLCAGKMSLTHISLPASLRHIGARAFENCVRLAAIRLPEGLQIIGEHAFENCTELSAVNLPASLTEVGQYAFNGCSGLQSLTYDVPAAGGSYLFSACNALTEVTLGKAVRELPDGLFIGCSALRTLTGGNGLEIIGANAFSGCGALDSFTFAPTVSRMGGLAFSGTALTHVDLPEALDSIGESVFSGCNLKRLSVQGSLNRMNPQAFYGCQVELLEWNVPQCPALANGIDCRMAVVGSNVSTLPVRFLAHSDVTSVTFEALSLLTEIADEAFYECRSLTSITLPASVTAIGEESFRYCSSLRSVSMAEQGGSAYASMSAAPGIGKQAFYYCSALQQMSFPGKITYIGEQAFQNCAVLSEVQLPEGVTSIGPRAFYQCAGLKHLGLPSTLQAMESEAFAECGSLERVNCPIAEPLPIDITVFWNVPSACVLCVPEGSLMAYLTATRWCEFNVQETPVGVPTAEADGAFRSAVQIQGRRMVFTPQQGCRVAVYSADGRCLYAGAGRGSVELPARGLYVVRVGSGRAQRVWVE